MRGRPKLRILFEMPTSLLSQLCDIVQIMTFGPGSHTCHLTAAQLTTYSELIRVRLEAIASRA